MQGRYGAPDDEVIVLGVGRRGRDHILEALGIGGAGTVGWERVGNRKAGGPRGGGGWAETTYII